jgi:glutaredoxin
VTRVTLYGKPGCCLCDDARELVERARGRHGFELEEIDVSADAGLHHRYGERIPVLAVDGHELLELRIDAAGLERVLGRVAGS